MGITDQRKSNIFPMWVLLNVALSYLTGKHNLSPIEYFLRVIQLLSVYMCMERMIVV